jgi:putative acetyltransferase
MRKPILSGLLVAVLVACSKADGPVVWAANHETTGPTRFPLAIDPAAVGTYPVLTRSGGGYFYDDVLEYRVWLHPEQGAERVAGGNDYFAAFAQYERAVAFAKVTAGAEQQPLVLVRQREWIDEPEPGHFVPRKEERITEWQLPWLADGKRGPDSIARFLANPKTVRDQQPDH